MYKAKSIMIQGTSSGVGKSIITTALCRIFKRHGYKVAPFKSQNVTTNTAFTECGDEIAVSQLIQAMACGISPHSDMNPLILKMGGADGTEVVLSGKKFNPVDGYKFKDVRENFLPVIMKSYKNLADEHDIIVIEGAGSPAELNLNKNDIVNMGVAKRTGSPVILVGDIDRGGVFAALYGTVKILDETERKYIKATVVNRFKGDISYFHDGVKILEDITEIPVAGVVPYIEFRIPEEDCLYDKNASVKISDQLESQFDIIADAVEQSLDMDLIYKILNEGEKPDA